MADNNKAINFQLSRIATEEFAITEETYDPAQETQIKLNLNFGFLPGQSTVVVRVKCLLYQDDRLLLVIAVSCWFATQVGDWHSRFDETTKTFWLHSQAALLFASLTANTARGVLHAKTEDLPINGAMLPTVNLDEIIKEDMVLALKE
jgi:hypothetical protein